MHTSLVKITPEPYHNTDKIYDDSKTPLDLTCSKKGEINIGHRQMRRIPYMTGAQGFLCELSGSGYRWALQQKETRLQNESLIRTYHPFLRNSKEVLILTAKKSLEKVWVVSNIENSNDDWAAGMGFLVHPSFETPTGASTLEDPLDHEISVDVPLATGDKDKIQSIFPKSIEVSVDKCECVIVRFGNREDMLQAWEAGTSSRIGNLVVGYQVQGKK